MSIALVVTRGFGNGTFNGTIKDVVLRGYSIGEDPPIWTKQANAAASWAAQADSVTTWAGQADSSTTWTPQ